MRVARAEREEASRPSLKSPPRYRVREPVTVLRRCRTSHVIGRSPRCCAPPSPGLQGSAHLAPSPRVSRDLGVLGQESAPLPCLATATGSDAVGRDDAARLSPGGRAQRAVWSRCFNLPAPSLITIAFTVLMSVPGARQAAGLAIEPDPVTVHQKGRPPNAAVEAQ